MLIVDHIVKIIRKEVAMAYFKVLHMHLPDRLKITTKSSVRKLVYEQKPEHGTSQI
jgi:hypothetical protein